MSSDSGAELMILKTLKQWVLLSESEIARISNLSHRRCVLSLGMLEQKHFVRVVENKKSIKTFRITGVGLDRLDTIKRGEHGPREHDL